MQNNIEKQAAGLQVFDNNKLGVRIRTQVINKEPWFVAKDVCHVLGIQNARQAMAKTLDEDEKGVYTIYTLGGAQKMNLINESGLYHLIFQSRKPKAQTFRRWVTGEILPSIRKTGRYERKRSLLPREKSEEMRSFFDELTHWTTPEDERAIAREMNVTQKHVHAVVRGWRQSYGVTCMLVEQAKDNHTKGICRPPHSVSREKEMNELMLEFKTL